MSGNKKLGRNYNGDYENSAQNSNMSGNKNMGRNYNGEQMNTGSSAKSIKSSKIVNKNRNQNFDISENNSSFNSERNKRRKINPNQSIPIGYSNSGSNEFIQYSQSGSTLKKNKTKSYYNKINESPINEDNENYYSNQSSPINQDNCQIREYKNKSRALNKNGEGLYNDGTKNYIEKICLNN